MSGASRLGVLVPCRNEAGVIRRKLRNLGGLAWPEADGAHRICVVDDGSTDDTLELARAACHELSRDGRIEAVVVTNEVRAGKPGAIHRGLEELDGCDLIVLTDADVVLEAGALTSLARAFESNPRLGMACGSQRFVRELAADGSAPPCGNGTTAAASTYDRLTALVRRLESRAGRLFSVHGQLLAWRAALGLRPTFGIAADDLDLMLQLRERREAEGDPVRVSAVPEAVFHEVKTPPGEAARDQALRRARAFVQVVRRHRPRTFADPLARLQWAFYRHAPLAAPLVSLILALGLPVVWAGLFGPRAGIGAALVMAALLLTPPGRRFVRLMLLIQTAVRREDRESLPECWEMARLDRSL